MVACNLLLYLSLIFILSYAQCDLLMKDLTTRHVLGTVVADFKVIEFQKRGLPHAHILLVLAPTCKPTSPRDYDYIVSAEIPDPHLHPAAYDTVTRMMMHGPCGELFPQAPCMVNGRCSKRYPKEFVEETTTGPSGKYPIYKRPNNGRTYRVSNLVSLDNRWVVPHNVPLCTKYNAHINVEICTGVQAVKYLYKYVFKGHDKALVSMRRSLRQGQRQQASAQRQEQVNEIQLYQEARYVSASEAIWRLYSFSLFHRSPAVQLLLLHLPNQQAVYYRETDDLESIVQRTMDHTTTLLAFFELNR